MDLPGTSLIKYTSVDVNWLGASRSCTPAHHWNCVLYTRCGVCLWCRYAILPWLFLHTGGGSTIEPQPNNALSKSSSGVEGVNSLAPMPHTRARWQVQRRSCRKKSTWVSPQLYLKLTNCISILPNVAERDLSLVYVAPCLIFKQSDLTSHAR